MSALPLSVKHQTLEQGYDARDAFFRLVEGQRRGWKLSVGSPAAMCLAGLLRPLIGQLERSRLHASGVHLNLPADSPIIIECEIAFLTFEVVRSRFVDRKVMSWPSFAADNVGFEALVVGKSIFEGLDEAALRELVETTAVYLNGEPKAKGLCGDTATEPLASLAAL